MVQLLLEVPQNQDLHSLLELFKKLNLRVLLRSEESSTEPRESNAQYLAFSNTAQSPAIDFESLIHEFETQQMAANELSLSSIAPKSYPVWTPLEAYAASDILTQLLQDHANA